MALSPAAPPTVPAVLLPRPRPMWRRVKRHPLFWIGAGILLLIALLCFVGPLMWRVGPLDVRGAWFSRPPGPGAPLGADALGRDELARVMAGGQWMLAVSVGAAILATAIGTGAGLVAGYRGGLPDAVISWILNVFLGVPQLVPLLLIDALLRPTNLTMMVVVAATGWPGVARLVRAETLALRERAYVESARAAGATDGAVLTRHVLPGLMGLVLVAASFEVGTAMMVVATASYLGLGLPPPWPNWGSMLSDSVDALIANQWWLVLPPALAYALTQIGVNFLADGIREAHQAAAGGAT